MLKMMNNLLSLLCSFCVALSPALVHAQESNVSSSLVTNLKKGEKAPFSGILLSDTAAAKLFADIKFSKEECKLKLDEELQVTKIRNDAQVQALELQLKVEKKRSESLLSVKDDRIAFLEKNYMPPAWYESQELWFAIGVIAGVGLTAAAGYAIGQAN